MARKLILLICAAVALAAHSQARKPYDESIDPMAQIDQALDLARQQKKLVMCQLGGNWCRWCLMFADFITADEEIARIVDDNYVYIHVNYVPGEGGGELMQRLGNAGRFGYPVLVLLDASGRVAHIQDTGLLEEGQGYDREKVKRFFELWAPAYVNK